jgi:glycine/D-amino acid oxidase-like deaminating enzyme
MSIDAMKAALEYTRPGAIVPVTPEIVKILVDALRLAIEQAERQESYWQEEARRYAGNADFWREKAKRQPLTDEEIGLLTTGDGWSHCDTHALALFARAIERKHGIGGGE